MRVEIVYEYAERRMFEADVPEPGDGDQKKITAAVIAEARRTMPAQAALMNVAWTEQDGNRFGGATF